jgi:solute carrier family 25 (mitochondrial carnitine/acylcarnitine transporter), member 20/29
MSDILSAVATPSTVNELVSGSVAGAAQVLVGQPLDTVKTRAQIAPSRSRAMRCWLITSGS